MVAVALGKEKEWRINYRTCYLKWILVEDEQGIWLELIYFFHGKKNQDVINFLKKLKIKNIRFWSLISISLISLNNLTISLENKILTANKEKKQQQRFNVKNERLLILSKYIFIIFLKHLNDLIC
jgi:hypothetical protein